MILELLLAHAPDAFDLQDLAKEYGADKDRFEKEASFCIHCGLCVRYCAEVKKKNAVGFVDRGIRKEISFIPEIASKECWNCKECFPLCPTEALQAAFVLTKALDISPTFIRTRVRGIGNEYTFKDGIKIVVRLFPGSSGIGAEEVGHLRSLPIVAVYHETVEYRNPS